MSQTTLPISSVGNLRGTESTVSRNPVEKPGSGASFNELLKTQLGEPKVAGANNTQQLSSLKFSAHAIDRLKSRGISFDQETLQRIEQAVDKAAQKGSRDSLVLTDDSALIVSVKNKTIVTAMDRSAMKENVFTNIDSTVII